MSPDQARKPATTPATFARQPSDPARVTTSPNARLAPDGALRHVCDAAAIYDRASGPAHCPPGHTVVAALAGAVRAYAEQCRIAQLPPERALVDLKRAVADCAPYAGRARVGQGFHDVVFAEFLAAYFPG